MAALFYRLPCGGQGSSVLQCIATVFNDKQIKELVRLDGQFAEMPQNKIFPIDAFGYRRMTI